MILEIQLYLSMFSQCIAINDVICTFSHPVFSNQKRASLACAALLADTLCPPEAPRLTIINYKVDNISKYVCLTVIIAITRKITRFVNF